LGLADGYYRGLLDALTVRIVDVVMVFPGILLALVIIAILGPPPLKRSEVVIART